MATERYVFLALTVNKYSRKMSHKLCVSLVKYGVGLRFSSAGKRQVNSQFSLDSHKENQ